MAIFTAIAGAISAAAAWIGTLGAIGSFLLKTAVGIGLNLLASAIAGKPSHPGFSIRGTLQTGGALPRSFIMGRTATAGSLVWANTWGEAWKTPNAYLTQVIAISDMPCQSLDELWVNGEKVTIAGDPKFGDVGVVQYRKDGEDHMWVRFFDGTQTSADPTLVNKASNSQRQWPSTRVGRGICYVVVTCKVAEGLFSGIPTFKFAVTGMKLYDPSRDSTVAGGSGPHRYNDPSTWGGDGDHLPAVQIYNLMRGITYNGSWFYGLQNMPAARIPTAPWITQIEKCRAGDTYRSGGEITIDAPITAAIEALLSACQGRVTETGGVYSLYLGEPDAPVALFHDDHILSTEGQSFTPFFGLADTINGIVAKYPSPSDGWGEKSAPPLYRTDLEAMAGGRRLMADVSLTFVPYPEQVQRLMRSALFEGQRARRHTITLPPEFWAYAVPGAVFSWTSPRNGYVQKWFRVDGVIDKANLDIVIDITEVDPADFDWNPATDYTPPVDGAFGPMRPPSQPLIGWQVFPATISHGGKEMPSIRVSYPGNLEDVRAIRVQVRLDATDGVMFDGEVPYGDYATNDNPSSVVLQGTFLPDTDYEVRGKLVPYGDRFTDWTEWLSVKTPNVWISDIYPVDIDRLADDLKGYLDWVGDGRRETERRFEEIELWMADQDFGNAYDRQNLRKQITATYETSRAEWTYDVNVVATANLALAQRVEELDAEVFDPVTGLPAVANAVDILETSVSVIDGDVTAMANAITSLSASTTPGDISEANFRMNAVAGPAGYSRIGLETRQGGSGVWRGAAIFLDTPNNPALPTRVSVLADQFVISSGVNSVNPFLFDGGEAYMNVANIGLVRSGRIESTDSKFIIDLNNKFILISDDT